MKIVIISDLHGNFDALSALPETYDELWVLGDLVNYGPQPREVVQFVEDNAEVVVRGNHDNAVGCNEDPRCTPAYAEMAEATRQFSMSVLNAKHKEFLCRLPLQISLERGRTRFYLCHAMPSEPLFGYCPHDSEQWLQEASSVEADFLLVGHTHTPFIRKVGTTIVVNPGSLGQPKTGHTEACYAVWEHGTFLLKSSAYSIKNTISKIKRIPIPASTKSELIFVLKSGGKLPQKDLRRRLHVGD